jgi:hypothetical protein
VGPRASLDRCFDSRTLQPVAIQTELPGSLFTFCTPFNFFFWGGGGMGEFVSDGSLALIVKYQH